MSTVNVLQELFKEKIIYMEELTPGYVNHGSDVWLIRTESEEVIVRASKSANEPLDGPFWRSCNRLFGIDPRKVHSLEAVNNILSGLSCIKIPKVIGKGFIDREYVIVEKVTGHTLKSFIGEPEALLFKFGVGLAEIHKKQMNYAGNPLGTFRVPVKDFHKHLSTEMQNIVREEYQENAKIVALLKEISSMIDKLPNPVSTSYILVDMDPTQFLTDGSVITGLVDTEAYILGPRELDFIALEYVFDQRCADIFTQGYNTVLSVPRLDRCRVPYRYLYRLIEIQGRVDIDKWLNHPIVF